MSLAKSILSADLASPFPNPTSPDTIKISLFMPPICPKPARAAILKLSGGANQWRKPSACDCASNPPGWWQGQRHQAESSLALSQTAGLRHYSNVACNSTFPPRQNGLASRVQRPPRPNDGQLLIVGL